MSAKDYIASGILELYVAGALNKEQNLEVAAMANKHPEVAQEIERIEAAIIKLTSQTAPSARPELPKSLGSNAKVKPLWPRYIGWAAAGLFAIGLTYMFNSNLELKNQLTDAEKQRELLEEQFEEFAAEYDSTVDLLDAIRAKEVRKIALPGQGAFDTSYAAAYWNEKEQELYVDIAGLPKAPEGMQYQLWSLTLDPLTPTSLGVFDASPADLQVYAFENPNNSEAFGITLEPTGGSESPTLERLYVLGATATP